MAAPDSKVPEAKRPSINQYCHQSKKRGMDCIACGPQ